MIINVLEKVKNTITDSLLFKVKQIVSNIIWCLFFDFQNVQIHW